VGTSEGHLSGAVPTATLEPCPFFSESCHRSLFDHTAGYARFDMGAWYAVHRRVTILLRTEKISLTGTTKTSPALPALGSYHSSRSEVFA